MKTLTLTTALVAAMLASSALTPAFAQSSREIPSIDTTRSVSDASNVNFVTGGIGDDERQAIEATAASYNVHITSSSTNGAFVEDTQVIIRNKAGDEVLNANAGPLLYVQLPAGTYSIEATHGDQTQKKRLIVGKKTSAKVHLGWKVPATVTDDNNQ